MYSTVETLLHKWDSGSECVIVSCDDEDQPTQEKPVQADEFDVILDESPVQCEMVTLHEQELEEEETTAINCSIEEEETTAINCSNEEEESTAINCSNEEEETTINKEELTFKAVKMEQLATPSATPLPVKKTSIHPKPCTKIVAARNILQSIGHQKLRRNIALTQMIFRHRQMMQVSIHIPVHATNCDMPINLHNI